MFVLVRVAVNQPLFLLKARPFFDQQHIFLFGQLSLLVVVL